MVEFIISPFEESFIEYIAETKQELFICSPYVDAEGIGVLKTSVSPLKDIKVKLITDLTVNNILNNGVDLRSLIELSRSVKDLEVSSCGRLHAKVYIVDNSSVIITSANITGNGLRRNLEYTVAIAAKEHVQQVRTDMQRYFSLGNVFSCEDLGKLYKNLERLFRLQKKIQSLKGYQRLLKEIKKEAQKLEIELLKNRVKGGKTVNQIFAETIIYLLKKKGPMSTKQLHPLVQKIHPDICDDSIDRVINGQHFEKKWKHLVRNAQQYLKRKGIIELKQGKWHLVS